MLPGVDDGPADLEAAVAMVRAAGEAGTSTLAATPHLRSDFPRVRIEELHSRVEQLAAATAAEGIPVRVVSAAEASLVWAMDATEEELRLASFGQRGTDLLVETPAATAIGLDRFLYGLRSRGIRVILGHPERAAEFQRNLEPLRTLAEHGVVLQVNAESLLVAGRGSSVRRLAQDLLRDGLAQVVASDGHRATSWRPVTLLPQVLKTLEALVGRQRARWLMSDAPRAIVDGLPLEEGPPVVQRRRLLKRP